MRWHLAGALLIATACAKIAPPPGGPPDALAPVLVATRPDSLGVYPGFEGSAEFRFDETVSEGSQPNLGNGTGDLERMVVLSPSDEIPKVRWERSRITVSPREGWRPNTVYRIELLPGLMDLRRNRERGGQVITFSTGAPVPTDTLRGIVVDWTTKQPARLAGIEAILLPDSLPYRTQADSTGRFLFGPLPHGAYLLRGFVDQNKNRRLDGRESWDSTGVSPAPAANAILWLAPRDTTGPRLALVTPRDSMTIELQLSQLVDPAQLLDTTNVRLVLLPDSTPVAVLSFRAKALDDSLVARARAVADSLRADSVARARPDSARPPAPGAPRPAPPRPAAPGRNRAPPVDSVMIRLLATRPTLSDRVVLRTAAPLGVETSYAVEILGIRNVNQVAGRALVGFKTPKRAVADSTPSDSLLAPTRPGARARPRITDSTTVAPRPVPRP